MARLASAAVDEHFADQNPHREKQQTDQTVKQIDGHDTPLVGEVAEQGQRDLRRPA